MKSDLNSWNIFSDTIDQFMDFQPSSIFPLSEEGSDLMDLEFLGNDGKSSLCPDPIPCVGSVMNSGDSVGRLVQTSCHHQETRMSHPGGGTCQSFETELPGSVNNKQDAAGRGRKDERLEDRGVVEEIGTEENSTIDTRVEDCSKLLPLQKIRNMKERKRREKIKKQVEALHKLMPHSDKSDKASILADAVEYIKFLQLKLQACGLSSNMYMSKSSAATQLPPSHDQFFWGQTAPLGGIPLLGKYSSSPSFVPAAPLPLFHGMPFPRNCQLLHQYPLCQHAPQDMATE